MKQGFDSPTGYLTNRRIPFIIKGLRRFSFFWSSWVRRAFPGPDQLHLPEVSSFIHLCASSKARVSSNPDGAGHVYLDLIDQERMADLQPIPFGLGSRIPQRKN